MTATSDQEAVWLLHRLDVEREHAQFVSSSLARLRGMEFLDGRQRFWDEQRAAALPLTAERSGLPGPRYIFHVSFCGSTLLATLLDTPGAVLALKEPQALVDVSDWLVLRPTSRHSPATVLNAVGNALLDPRATTETVVVKPSNWANNLVPHLCRAGNGTPAIFMTMPIGDFLRAVFRGGRDRMAYTARATAHLASTGPAAAALQDAIAGGIDPLDRVARIAALGHRLQEHIFRGAMNVNGWDEAHWFELDQLVGRPAETVLRAGTALGLHVDPGEVERRVAAQTRVHAKNGGTLFDAAQRDAENRNVDRDHGKMLRKAAAWSASIAL